MDQLVRILLKYCLALCLLIPVDAILISAVQAQNDDLGRLFAEMIEDGGNGAAYGIVAFSGPESKSQSFNCPRNSLGQIPNLGRTRCFTYFGTSNPDEWGPGDVITAFVPREGSTDIPLAVRPEGSSICLWEFTGFTGLCDGMGVKNTTKDGYECTFVLPANSDIVLGVKIKGQLPSGIPGPPPNTACPAIPDTGPADPTPKPSAVPTPGSGDNEILDALSDAMEDLAQRLRIREILDRIVAGPFFPKTPGFSYRISTTVTATGEGTRNLESRKKGKKKKKKGKKNQTPIQFDGEQVIAEGSINTSGKKRERVKIKTTRIGRRIAVGRDSLSVRIDMSASLDGEEIAAVSTDSVLNR